MVGCKETMGISLNSRIYGLGALFLISRDPVQFRGVFCRLCLRCLAHHLTVDGGKRRLMIAALRYYDTFAKMDGAWLFAERLFYVDWIEERGLS